MSGNSQQRRKTRRNYPPAVWTEFFFNPGRRGAIKRILPPHIKLVGIQTHDNGSQTLSFEPDIDRYLDAPGIGSCRHDT